MKLQSSYKMSYVKLCQDMGLTHCVKEIFITSIGEYNISVLICDQLANSMFSTIQGDELEVNLRYLQSFQTLLYKKLIYIYINNFCKKRVCILNKTTILEITTYMKVSNCFLCYLLSISQKINYITNLEKISTFTFSTIWKY